MLTIIYKYILIFAVYIGSSIYVPGIPDICWFATLKM
jgi:hypothetical protein